MTYEQTVVLLARTTGFTVVCPAFPETGRTIFKGHLFVGDLLLSDTHMRTHPLTPMTDASLVRVLQAALLAAAGCHQLEVVDDDQAEIRLAPLQRLRAGPELEQAEGGGVVDVQRR